MLEYFNFELLLMIKIFYDHTGIWYNAGLYDYEDGTNFELFQDMAHHIFDRFYDGFDDWGNLFLDIFDSQITEFYDLCKEYSRKKHLAFDKNPYVTALKKKIHSFGYDSSFKSEDGDALISLSINEIDAIESAALLENLLLLKEFLDEQTEKLNAVLYPTVGQGSAVSERRAA